MSGLFVTIDGPGGVGKSTVLEHVRQGFVRDGIPVHATTEPSHTRLGDLARHGTETFRGMALACLVAADRYHHLETEITPAVERGAVVLCDRYIGSSLVLQRLDGVSLDTVRAMNRDALRPDLSVILNADPDVIRERLAARGTHSRFEKTPESVEKEPGLFAEAATFLSEVGFRTLVLDCTSRSPEQIAGLISAEIAMLLTRGNRAN
ncbi:dTMP kinase [Streptacidiphilus sp. P02-A3a]|uniref:dTMP kinase n=1 Tax=Streptacidiphilus sp. P02-A3a TaxID=2704468 RepID=UPI0015FB88F9|nr:dTMP kinase [Streptacidiphilus sp. P02-A3a]QMU70290.1 dTMP kinase [Streptacidiphilus sp. P02-A3a]